MAYTLYQQLRADPMSYYKPATVTYQVEDTTFRACAGKKAVDRNTGNLFTFLGASRFYSIGPLYEGDTLKADYTLTVKTLEDLLPRLAAFAAFTDDRGVTVSRLAPSPDVTSVFDSLLRSVTTINRNLRPSLFRRIVRRIFG